MITTMSESSRKMQNIGYGVLENLTEEIPRLPEGVKFCGYIGTKYNCCKRKACFDNVYCGVRRFREKYDNPRNKKTKDQVLIIPLFLG